MAHKLVNLKYKNIDGVFTTGVCHSSRNYFKDVEPGDYIFFISNSPITEQYSFVGYFIVKEQFIDKEDSDYVSKFGKFSVRSDKAIRFSQDYPCLPILSKLSLSLTKDKIGNQTQNVRPLLEEDVKYILTYIKQNESDCVLIANITWNEYNWKDLYVNPKAGHEYARQFPGHESLNFKFDKANLDTSETVHGYVQWTNPPIKLKKEGSIIFFYTKNLTTGEGEIVGLYGEAKVVDSVIKTAWEGFENDELWSNISAKKELSALFPFPLKADYYAISGERLVPQVGYKYKDLDFALRVISDEISLLEKNGIRIETLSKLYEIYRHISGTEYQKEETRVTDRDHEEQIEISEIIKSQKALAEQISKKLKKAQSIEPKLITILSKQYKRNNVIISLIKDKRGSKCQICNQYVETKGGPYIEAAHITPKSLKGSEEPQNIILLCPNHHKEFDLGDKKILERDGKKITFLLNGKNYTVKLSLL